jgi:hypothetical protein
VKATFISHDQAVSELSSATENNFLVATESSPNLNVHTISNSKDGKEYLLVMGHSSYLKIEQAA